MVLLTSLVFVVVAVASLIPAHCDKISSHCGSRRLQLGGCVFVFAAVDIDDAGQMALLPHFIAHYDAMGVPRENFLFLIHARQPTGFAEAEAAAHSLRKTMKVTHAHTPLLVESAERDSPHDFLSAIWTLFREVLSMQDWVIHVELDELVIFPTDDHVSVSPAATLPDILTFFNAMDMEGNNIIYGFVIDRLALDGTLPPVLPKRDPGNDLFDQFPLTCCATSCLRRADVRRTVAYKGYIRVDLGHHIGLGVPDLANGSDSSSQRPEPLWPAPGSEGWAGYMQMKRVLGRALRKKMSRSLSLGLFSLLPDVYRRSLPFLVPWFHFASVFHFKWNAGLEMRVKLLKQRGWAVTSFWQQIDTEFDDFESKLPVEGLCKQLRSETVRNALSSEELLIFHTDDKGREAFFSGHYKQAVRIKLNGQRDVDTSRVYEYDRRLLLYTTYHFHYRYDVDAFLDLMSRPLSPSSHIIASTPTLAHDYARALTVARTRKSPKYA